MIEQLNKIIENKNNEQTKYSKGLKKIISGVAILALFGVLLTTYSSFPILIAIDNLFASFAGGIISPLLVAGVGAFGSIKTIMGGIKSIKAKRALDKIKNEEKEMVVRIDTQTKEAEEKVRTLTDDNNRLQAEKAEILTNYKGIRSAIKSKINKVPVKSRKSSQIVQAEPIQATNDDDMEMKLAA